MPGTLTLPCQITGYPKEEVVWRNLVQDFITPDYQESVQEVLQNALLGKETDNFEFPLYTKDGTRVYVLLNASSRRDRNDNIVGVVGVGQDITARKVSIPGRGNVDHAHWCLWLCLLGCLPERSVSSAVLRLLVGRRRQAQCRRD